MQPSLALFLWFVLLIALLWRDPARVRGTSVALWLAVINFIILTSRLPSQWLGMVRVGAYAQVLEEGSALDRSIYLILIGAAVAVLISRSFDWMQFWRRNVALLVFLLFALVSVLWSDYTFIAFKRWFRDLTQYMTLLVVLTDPKPLEAIRAVYRRSCYILIPLSVVLIKYFQEIGRQYELYSGLPMYVGATTSKNMLGALCMFSMLFFAWDTLQRWRDRREPQTKRILYVNAAFLLMTAWLLDKANSATSNICLALGLIVIAASHFSVFRRRPARLFVSIPVAFLVYATVTFGFGIDLNAVIATALGRDPTLTGRTYIWETLLRFVVNPVVGAGYETFWLGPRLDQIWQLVGTINHAHNGYLNVYLNLGMIGVLLMVLFLLGAYRRMYKRFKDPAHRSVAILGTAGWALLLFYNMTESAFPTGPLWLLVLTSALVIPQPEEAAEFVTARRSSVTPAAAQRPVVRRPAVGTPAPAGAPANPLGGKPQTVPRFHLRRRWSPE